MIMEIHSKFGKLIAVPMMLQAIENSIPEASIGAEQDFQGDESSAED